MPTLKLKRTHVGRLPYGSDLLDGLTAFAKQEGIQIGKITAIGATMHAVVAYYDQTTRTYNPMEFSGGMEILALNGNISLRDGEPFVHAHILLGDREGKTFGGHLMKGTTLWALELFVEEYEGDYLDRKPDPETGLWLWSSSRLLSR